MVERSVGSRLGVLSGRGVLSEPGVLRSSVLSGSAVLSGRGVLSGPGVLRSGVRSGPGDGWRAAVVVRVKPGAGRTRVGGRCVGPHGPALIVAVGAPAVDGKATGAARRALAGALGVRVADVELRVGATSRDKVFIVTGDAAVTAERLLALRDGST
jgi:uncharacterized protein